MNIIRTVLSLLLVSAVGVTMAPSSAHANPLSYSYIRAGKAKIESDGFGDKAKGTTLKLSVQAGNNVFFVAQGAKLDFKTLTSGLRQYGLGIGYQENPQGDVSAFLMAEGFETRLQPDGGGDYVSDRWARFSWGFRSLVSPGSPWEFDGGVYYDAWTNFNTDHRFGFWLGLGVVFNHIGLHIVRNHNSSQNTIRLNASVSF